MSWQSFILGRPTNEYTFEVPPGTMSIDPQNVEVLQRNLAGDYKQSILKVNCPQIKIASNFLSIAQRNQFASLVGVADTFLSFQCRTDWTVDNELVSILTANTVQLMNSSAARLSAVITAMGGSSIITILTSFNTGSGPAFGLGNPFGGGSFGIGLGGGTFNPGTVVYNDATRVITMQNPLPSLNISLYVSYTYTGWLVKMKGFPHKYQGGWIDRATYDVSLEGA